MSALSNDTASDQKAQPNAVALFVSDVHLSDALPHTTEKFLQFLAIQAVQAQRLYVLGDLFEYWAGDDDCETPYNDSIVTALRAVSDNGVELYWIAGNRDFLVGEDFAQRTGAQLLEDPHELQLAGQHLLISHGDALCTDDVSYMAFRSMVRNPAWQEQFLAKPLSERKAIIQGMRQASSSEQKNKSMTIMDVNQNAVAHLCEQYQGASLIHGHTHRTAMHSEAYGLRYVLPDWDCDRASKLRGGYLQLEADGKLQFFYL
ncbi:UDP-2,3-diacylglucosamine diphosphatase [Undibacterium sp. Di24W]|uniref:UDP-2,3-diacylglucosamine diphosphatase n=1 Tax=Undibacterium sp. Di24W TaxID=3413033 RepID=UPI003BEFAE80